MKCVSYLCFAGWKLKELSTARLWLHVVGRRLKYVQIHHILSHGPWTTKMWASLDKVSRFSAGVHTYKGIVRFKLRPHPIVRLSVTTPHVDKLLCKAKQYIMCPVVLLVEEADVSTWLLISPLDRLHQFITCLWTVLKHPYLCWPIHFVPWRESGFRVMA